MTLEERLEVHRKLEKIRSDLYWFWQQPIGKEAKDLILGAKAKMDEAINHHYTMIGREVAEEKKR